MWPKKHNVCMSFLKKNSGHIIKILLKARCFFPVWSSLSGPFMSMGLHGWGGDGGQSPVVEVTAKTSLCPRPPQFITQRQLSQYTHTHLLVHRRTHHVCIAWSGMTSSQTHPSSCNMARVPDRPAPMEFPGN